MSKNTTVKWAEISKIKHTKRYDFLAKYLNDKSFSNEVHYYDIPLEEFESKIEELKAQYDQIRLGSPYAESVGTTLTQSTIGAFTLRSCDALVKENGKWWPRSMMATAFVESIAKSFGSLDLSASALIVGVGTRARAVFWALMNLGYKKFLFTEMYEERAGKTLDALRRNFFDIEIEFVEQKKLAYLPGASSIVVNTTPYTEDNDLLKDLFYFNYITKRGVVVDTNYFPVSPLLIEQARDLNLSVLDGISLCSRVDLHWLKTCFGKEFDYEDYEPKWREYLTKNSAQT